VMKLNPLTYGLAGVRGALYLHDAGVTVWPSLALSAAVSIVFAGAMFILASVIAGGRTAADLQ